MGAGDTSFYKSSNIGTTISDVGNTTPMGIKNNSLKNNNERPR